MIIDQFEILQKIADNYGEKVTHMKPHGALNNMACEDIDLATTLAKVINEISKDLIYLASSGSVINAWGFFLETRFPSSS